MFLYCIYWFNQLVYKFHLEGLLAGLMFCSVNPYISAKLCSVDLRSALYGQKSKWQFL